MKWMTRREESDIGGGINSSMLFLIEQWNAIGNVTFIEHLIYGYFIPEVDPCVLRPMKQ